MPEIPFYNGGAPAGSPDVPQAPLNRAQMPDINLSGLQSQVRQTGQVAAQAAEAGAHPLANPNMNAPIFQGVEALGQGFEKLGDAVNYLAVKRAEAQNKIDENKAQADLDNAYASEMNWRLQNPDPRKWEEHWQSTFNGVQQSYQDNDDISGAAKAHIGQLFAHIGGRYTIDTATLATRKTFADAKASAIGQAEAAAQDPNSTIEQVTAPLANAHANEWMSDQELQTQARRLKGELQASQVKAMNNNLALVTDRDNPDFDAARQIIADARGRNTIDDVQAKLLGNSIDSKEQESTIRSAIAQNPSEALKALKGPEDDAGGDEGGDNQSGKPDLIPVSIGGKEFKISALQQQKYQALAMQTQAHFNQFGAFQIQQAIDNNEVKTPQDLEPYRGQVEPDTLAAFGAKLQGQKFDEGKYADFVGQIASLNKANDPMEISRANMKAAIVSQFPSIAAKQLETMLDANYSANADKQNPAVTKALAPVHQELSKMLQEGAFGPLKVQSVDPATGQPLVTKEKALVIPQTVGSLWWKRPGTIADAKEVDQSKPLMEQSPAAYSKAFNGYLHVMQETSDWAYKNNITDSMEILEHANQQSRQLAIPNLLRAITPAATPAPFVQDATTGTPLIPFGPGTAGDAQLKAALNR